MRGSLKYRDSLHFELKAWEILEYFTCLLQEPSFLIRCQTDQCEALLKIIFKQVLLIFMCTLLDYICATPSTADDNV